ncbi:MAG: hypothetical protein LBQ84_00550 [Flavobacteriaceae bacterium]|jgi:hypothetical protein|nr:hypothetical protein [Flavobacteriaceae bacterium]
MKSVRERINASLVSSMKNNIPEGENLADILTGILNVGKESVYRRLRGEVPFTFEEVVKISRKLRVSLDNIVNEEKEHAVFSLHLIPSIDFMEDYYKALESNHVIFNMMSKDPDSVLRLAYNTLPYGIYLRYETISKFRLYKWVYQFLKTQTTVSLADFEVPEKILTAQKKFVENYYTISNIQIILDKNAFSSFITDINYFYRLNLISEKEIEELKEELLQMIFNWEQLAKKGITNAGKEINIYISNINFEACYVHFKSKELELSQISLYSIDTLTSLDPVICNTHKKWIDSLKRYSTLITRSGEIERIEFFNNQRKLITELLGTDACF